MPAAPERTPTQALQFAFTGHLRDPAGTAAPVGLDDRRLQVYRDLVYANMESFLSSNFPVIRSLYDDAAWERIGRAFLRDHRCHTPLFPEFAREFLRYLDAREAQGETDPPFLRELAHYEWAELALSLAEADIASIPHDADGDIVDGIPVLSPLANLLAYQFPVQHIAPDFRPDAPGAQPTLLLLVRGRDDEVRFHEINALSAMLLETLQANDGRSGRECVEAVLAAVDADTAANLRVPGIALLHELRDREAILGARLAA